MKTVAIIGGGISGLAGAEAIERRAKERGLAVQAIVLEAEKSPGGKIGTIRENGYVIETGPHGFLDKEPKAMALVDRLGLRPTLLSARDAAEKRYIVRDGKLRALPGSPPAFLVSDVLPLFGKLRVAIEPLVSKKIDGAEESVWEFASRRIGRQAADVLVDAMVTGIYGGDPKRLSVRAAFPLLEKLERDYGGLIKGQIAKAKEQKRSGERGSAAMGGPRGKLHSFKSGLGELIEALAKRCDLRTGFRASSMDLQGNLQIKDESGAALSADAIVITTPAYEIARLLRAQAPAEADALGSIRYVPVAVVVQAYRAEDFAGAPDGFGFLVPNGEAREILGSIWASSVFEGHAPPGTVMLRTLVGGSRRPELASGSDAELSLRARREVFEVLGVKKDTKPVHERVFRWDRAIPQYELGHTARAAAADAIEAKLPGIFLGGNALRGVAMIQCVADADLVADRVVTWLAKG
jgi:protoporphyrinogen/coproporphyrinogen III oxidase